MQNKLFLLICFCTTIPVVIMGQKPVSSGEIVYAVNYSSSKYTDQDFGTLPSTITYSFKDNMVRKEFHLSNDYKLTTLVDCNKKVVYVLKDISGTKTYTKVKKGGVKKDLKKKGVYSFLNENSTKVIAGYNCRKSVDTGNDQTVYSSTAVQVKEPNWNTKYRDVNGFLMEFSITNSDYTIHYVAESVTQKDLPFSLFAIPSDYKKVKRKKSRD